MRHINMYRRYYYGEIKRSRPNYCAYFMIGLVILTIICGSIAFVAKIDPKHFPSIIEKMIHDSEVEMAFENFKQDYERKYASLEEENTRKQIFRENYDKIEEINKHENSFKLGINKFADLTQDEFEDQYLSKPEYLNVSEVDNFTEKLSTISTSRKDWEDYLGPARDQGSCLCSWIFSVIAATEIIHYKTEHVKISLSEQCILDCMKEIDCGKGNPELIFFRLAVEGTTDLGNYLYKGRKMACRKVSAPVSVLVKPGFTLLNESNNDEIYAQLEKHAVVAGVNASPFEFRFYKKGVLNKACPPSKINHWVLITGTGVENEEYWNVRNSWGRGWGDNDGYIRIKKHNGINPGLCGIATRTYAPLYRDT